MSVASTLLKVYWHLTIILGAVLLCMNFHDICPNCVQKRVHDAVTIVRVMIILDSVLLKWKAVIIFINFCKY